MKYAAYLICLLAFTLMGFMMFNRHDQLYEISPREKNVNELLGKLAKFLSKKYNMQPIGTGVAMPGGNIKLLGLDFQIRGPLSKNKLRNILIHSAQDFIEIVNENQEIHKSLEHDPFEIQALDITLFVMDSKGYNIDHPDIGIASIRDGQLSFETYVTKDIPVEMTHEEESYDGALKLIRTSPER